MYILLIHQGVVKTGADQAKKRHPHDDRISKKKKKKHVKVE